MKSKKSFVAGLCSLALAASVAFSSIGYQPAQKVNVAAETFDVHVQSAVSYMAQVNVPTAPAGWDVKVIAPNGDEVSATTNFVANQLGHYTVTYTKTGTTESYSFTVFCSVEEDYKLVVKNEYEIPTYVKVGTAKKLPAAEVGYYNEDGEWVAVNSTVTVKTDKGEAITPGTDFTFANAGSTFVVYSAAVGGGTKYITKTYEVKVQADFEDTKAPTLSVSGVPTSGNVNMAVVLPKATATDTYDSNVNVVVTVKGKNASGELVAVKEVELNDNGIATAEKSTDAVFDNKENMTFYPVRNGDYKVTYQAIDDNGNTSGEETYTITVSDKKAPTITIDSAKIPAKWGYNKVEKLAGNDESVKESLTDIAITFPVPEFYDNKDAADDLIVTFAIKDPEDKTVVSFTNINSAEGSKYTSTVTNKEYTFTKDAPLSFNFKEYVDAVANNSNYQYEGNYVITYSAKDSVGNKAQKSFTINIVDTYSDDKAVNVSFNNVEKYVVANANKAVEFTVPTPVYSSAADTALALTYTVSCGANSVEVKSAEVVEIVKDGADYKLVAEAGSIVVTGDLTFTAVATSDAGNVAEKSETVKVLLPTSGKLYTAVESTISASGLTTAQVKQEVNGAIKVTGVTDAKSVGVEFGVKDSEGNYVTATAQVYRYDGALYVRNVSFDATKAGVYTVEARVYDINGNSTVSVSAVEVAQATAGGNDVIERAALNSTVGDVNVAIKFANESIDVTGYTNFVTLDADDALVLVSEVTGGKFAVLGDSFTARNTGRYTVTDKVVIISKANAANDSTRMAGDVKAFLDGKADSSTVLVKDNSSVKLEVQGEMPSYSEISSGTDKKYVELPKVAAFTDNAGATEIKLEVKSPKGNVVDYVESTTAGKAYKFEVTENGTYTVTYTVKVANKEDATFTYSVKTGDLVAPVITVDGTHATTLKAGEEFTFLKISATDNKTDAADLVYTKKVIGPDGNEVGTSISGTGTTYANRQTPTGGAFTLDASGKYTVRYEVKDAAGNVAVKEFEITVTNTTSNSGISLAALGGILIGVGVVLILLVVVYLFRFRRIKK